MAKYNPDIHHIHGIIEITTVGADSISALSISGKNDTRAEMDSATRAEMDSAPTTTIPEIVQSFKRY